MHCRALSYWLQAVLLSHRHTKGSSTGATTKHMQVPLTADSPNNRFPRNIDLKDTCQSSAARRSQEQAFHKYLHPSNPPAIKQIQVASRSKELLRGPRGYLGKQSQWHRVATWSTKTRSAAAPSSNRTPETWRTSCDIPESYSALGICLELYRSFMTYFIQASIF